MPLNILHAFLSLIYSWSISKPTLLLWEKRNKHWKQYCNFIMSFSLQPYIRYLLWWRGVLWIWLCTIKFEIIWIIIWNLSHLKVSFISVYCKFTWYVDNKDLSYFLEKKECDDSRIYLFYTFISRIFSCCIPFSMTSIVWYSSSVFVTVFSRSIFLDIA